MFVDQRHVDTGPWSPDWNEPVSDIDENKDSDNRVILSPSSESSYSRQRVHTEVDKHSTHSEYSYIFSLPFYSLHWLIYRHAASCSRIIRTSEIPLKSISLVMSPGLPFDV